jgi:hypothetical protein
VVDVTWEEAAHLTRMGKEVGFIRVLQDDVDDDSCRAARRIDRKPPSRPPV